MKIYSHFFQNLPLAPSHLRGGSFDVGGGKEEDTFQHLTGNSKIHFHFSSRRQTWSSSSRMGAKQDTPGSNLLLEPQQQIYTMGGSEKGKKS